MPISTADILDAVKWQGEDEENGVIKTVDTLTIQVKAQLDNEEIISKNQVKLCIYNPSNVNRPCIETNSYTNFNSCVKESDEDYYICTYSTEITDYGEKLNIQIDLYDDDNVLQEYVQKQVMIDQYNPKIKNFEINPKRTLGPVNLAVTAEDYGTNPSIPRSCAGIKEIRFEIDGEQVLKIQGEKNQCELRKGVPFIYEGSKSIINITAIAVDYLGRESIPKTSGFIMDTGAPQIEEITLVNEEEAKITHLKKDSEIPIRVRAKITDESGINDSTVKAILPWANSEKSYSEKDGDYYYWDANTIGIGDNGKITIKAEDNVGTKTQEEYNYNIKKDDVSPVKTKEMAIAKDDEGRPMLAYDSYLIIEFSEKDTDGNAGIGMNLAKAYMDLSKLGMGASVKADKCEQEFEYDWKCKWKIIPKNFGRNINSGVYYLSLLRKTQDDLGNTMTRDEPIEVYYQEEGPIKPVVIEYKVIPGPNGVGGEAVEGDTVQFKVRSRNFETAKGDFSEIGGDSEVIPSVCEYENITETDICSFEETVQIEGPIDAKINFTFTDIFDESESTEYELSIYELVGNRTYNNWYVKDVECSPQPIDRKTTSLLPQTIACKVNMKTSANIESVNIIGPSTVYDCEGNITGFIDDIRTINTIPGSKEPYFMVKLPARDYYLDNLTFRCPIIIYSKKEDTRQIMTEPEKEFVDVKLEFYDLPLGELYDNKVKKINHSINYARDLRSLTEDLEEAMDVAEKICQWKSIFTNIISSITTIVGVLGGIQDTFRTTFPPIADGVKAIRSPLCHTREVLDETFVSDLFGYLDTACSIINCQAQGGKEAWGLSAWAGGAAPWCTALNSWLANTDMGAGVRLMQGQSQYKEDTDATKYWATNIKDNIYLSIGCLCLPGIIKNLNKVAQIECRYATCLEQDYKQTGITDDVYCQNMKDNLMCSYVWGGPLFDLIPFSHFLESISQTLGELIANPVTIATTALGMYCESYCETEPATMHTICAVARVTSQISETVASISAMFDSKAQTQPVSTEWCNQMENWAKDYSSTSTTNSTGGGV